MDDQQIVALRPARNALDPWRPYASLVEPEPGPDGRLAQVATIFLTNRECPFRCLMCDLWRNTLVEPTPLGAIPAQIDLALAELPPAERIKLYNAGNFFDPLAIPRADHGPIAERLQAFATVVVENHPRMCGSVCGEFRRRLSGELEVALGLETIQPEVLPRLNKRMTVDDFDRAVEGLLRDDIAVRVFVLLRPPFVDEEQGVEWCLRSVDHALRRGARTVAIIPTRGGNGALEQLAARGDFAPPRLRSLETALETALSWRRGTVLADLWDLERLESCAHCGAARRERLRQMNLGQRIPAPIVCDACGEPERPR